MRRTFYTKMMFHPKNCVLVILVLVIIWQLGSKVSDKNEESSGSGVQPEFNPFDAQGNSEILPDDPKLLDYVLKNHLFPPAPVSYNLDEKYKQSDGQHFAVLKILNNKTNGVFVEAGANDGQFLSNTLELEKTMGWMGLLVEADGTIFEKLRSRRRRSWLSNACLSIKTLPMKATFVQNNEKYGQNKIANTEGVPKASWDETDKQQITVTCFPFYTLALALNMTVIDYFSLDIEGAELAVLKTIPFDKILIRTMTIEYNQIRRMKGADAELKKLMETNGFVLVEDMKGSHTKDYLYAHKSVLNK